MTPSPAGGTDASGESRAAVAGARANLEHAITGFEAERLHPIADQPAPQLLSRIDLVPTEMAEVLLEWLFQGGRPHRPKCRVDHPARPRVKRMESTPATRIAVGRLGLEIR